MPRLLPSAVGLGLALALSSLCGCGTTRWSDTARTATEQMLVSDAVDKAVDRIDLRSLSGKTIYFDDQYLKNTIDQQYLASSLRNRLLAAGCILKFKQEEADYVVEARAGAVGTDRHDLLFGVPAFTVPAFVSTTTGAPSVMPEIPFVKRTDQRGVAKVAMFAYNRATGRIVWQSGISPTDSNAKDLWVFGAGPFQKGSIREGTKFAGEDLQFARRHKDQPDDPRSVVSVTDKAVFSEPTDAIAENSSGIQQTGGALPLPPGPTNHMRPLPEPKFSFPPPTIDPYNLDRYPQTSPAPEAMGPAPEEAGAATPAPFAGAEDKPAKRFKLWNWFRRGKNAS